MTDSNIPYDGPSVPLCQECADEINLTHADWLGVDHLADDADFEPCIDCHDPDSDTYEFNSNTYEFKRTQ